MPAPIITICLLLIIEFRLNILRESRDVSDVFICAKNRFTEEFLRSYRNIFKKVVACCRNAVNPV